MEENKLAELRKRIDKLDNQMVFLLAQRMDAVRQVGEFKKKQNIPPLDESRWQEVLSSKMKLAEEAGIDPEVIKDLFNRIHEYALEVERDI
jgi:chorismate mutase